MKLQINLENLNIEPEKLEKHFGRAKNILQDLKQKNEPMTGWVKQPASLTEEMIADIEKTAEEIKSLCEVLVVIGVGGSYMGTACIEQALQGSRSGYPELVYAGHNFSGNYLSDIVEIVQNKETCLCVVSKSGSTMETSIAFNVLKEALQIKYGDKSNKRIIAITDPESGKLRKEAIKEGYKTFPIPSDIGGRYSAFTAGILFPLAVTGADIRKFIKGASDIAVDSEFWEKEGLLYALARKALLEAGKTVEVFEFYDPSLSLIGDWCEQLFGESEGKEGKGLFPAKMIFSRDLHSMGQFLQEGNQIFFETMINVQNWDKDVVLPETETGRLSSGLLNEINKIAMEGVIAAHSKAGVPIILIEIEDSKEYCLGQLLYFFMMTAAVTGKLMGINPFNQPGVEGYKSEIKERLGIK